MASGEWVDVQIRGIGEPDELLALLDDPAVTGAWDDGQAVHLYWPVASWSSEVLARLTAVVQTVFAQCDQGGGEPYAIQVDRLPDEDWNALWAKQVKPIRIGTRVVVRPSWESVPLAPGDIEIVLDPKQAFGSGHHATTQLMIELLEEQVKPGDAVLDIGSGSGLLAMVALRLGASRAVGVECDPVAMECAQGYAVENGFGSELQFHTGLVEDLPLAARRWFPLIVANIDQLTLIAGASSWGSVVSWDGTTVLLSGILRDQVAEVQTAFARIGARTATIREREGWSALMLTFPDACEDKD